MAYTRISKRRGDQLLALLDENRIDPGVGLEPFGRRPIPQPLGDAMVLKPIELLDDLFPCGYAYACSIDLAYDPPKPDYSNVFLVKDFFGLSGYAGWQGWADPSARSKKVDSDFTALYNTSLSAEDEIEFQDWAATANRLNDLYNYDLRGAWLAGYRDVSGHFPDTYKKPNHPTFSDESRYHHQDGYAGGHWSEVAGVTHYLCTETNLYFNGGRSGLTDYFRTTEPGVILDFPENESSSSSGEEFYPLVNIGPPCEAGSSSSLSSTESGESSLSEESSSSASSESSSSSSSSACPGGMYWVPIRGCEDDSGSSGSGNVLGWQIIYLPPGTCADPEWQPATFPRGGPTPPAV